MTRHIKRISKTPFDDVFRTLLEKCNKLIIPVINELFHTDYSFKDNVQVLANEQYYFDEDGSDIKKITDSYLKIRDSLYHIECQSTDDEYMEIRMMEYDFRIAMDNISLENNTYVADMPHSAVLVLNDDSHMPDTLNITLRFPTYNSKNSYETFTYSIPTCNINRFSHEEIRNKCLLFLTPYYILRFKKKLSEINKNGNQLNKLKAEYLALYEEIALLSEREDLTSDYLYDIVALTNKIISHVAKDMNNIKREVDIMYGEVLKTDREILIEKVTKNVTKKVTEEVTEQVTEQVEASIMQLINHMINDGYSTDDLKKLTDDCDYRNEMYKKYNLK